MIRKYKNRVKIKHSTNYIIIVKRDYAWIHDINLHKNIDSQTNKQFLKDILLLVMLLLSLLVDVL